MVSVQIMNKMDAYERSFFVDLPCNIEMHCRRVGAYSRILASNMIEPLKKKYANLNVAQIMDAVQLGGVYHDIGKIVCTPALLNKIDSLSEAERGVLQNHPRRSFEIIMEYGGLRDSFGYNAKRVKEIILDCCMYHHERFDGNGYPKRLRGNKIPLVAQIVSMSDMFDAKFYNEVYREKDLNVVMRAMVNDYRCCFAPQVIKCFKKSEKELGTALYFIKLNKEVVCTS